MFPVFSATESCKDLQKGTVMSAIGMKNFSFHACLLLVFSPNRLTLKNSFYFTFAKLPTKDLYV